MLDAKSLPRRTSAVVHPPAPRLISSTHRLSTEGVKPASGPHMYRAALSQGMDEAQKRDFVWKELKRAERNIDSKIYKSGCKAVTLRIAGDIASILIIIGGLIITYLQAISDNINIPVIIMGVTISGIQAIHRYFKWTERATRMKESARYTKRLKLEMRNVKYYFGDVPVDDILPMLDSISSRLEDIEVDDFSIRRGTVTYESGGFKVEDDNDGVGQHGNQSQHGHSGHHGYHVQPVSKNSHPGILSNIRHIVSEARRNSRMNSPAADRDEYSPELRSHSLPVPVNRHHRQQHRHQRHQRHQQSAPVAMGAMGTRGPTGTDNSDSDNESSDRADTIITMGLIEEE